MNMTIIMIIDVPRWANQSNRPSGHTLSLLIPPPPPIHTHEQCGVQAPLVEGDNLVFECHARLTVVTMYYMYVCLFQFRSALYMLC